MIQPFRPRKTSQDRWLVSYADLSTLLFALFATMYAISSVDATNMAKAAKAVQGAFPEARGRSIVPEAGVLPESSPPRKHGLDAGEDVREIVSRELAAEIEMRRIDLNLDHRGVILSIPESGLFAVGSDDMSAAAQALMIRIAAMLAKLERGNSIRVEGHTDDMPVRPGRFRSNWDLSTARATEVVTLLVTRGGISPARLSAAGYAEFHPRVANATAEDRAMNRRVDLVILNDTTARDEEPAPTPQRPPPAASN